MEHNSITFLGKHFSSPFFLSASPITSITCRDKNGNYDQEQLAKKIAFLLREGFNFGAAIMKTVYFPDETDNDGTSNTRVWVRDKDLFHIGHTPKEMLTTKELKVFLDRNEIKGLKEKIIISLGVKSADIYQWQKLFETLFKQNGVKIHKDCDIIEINTRHTLRELNMIYLQDKDIDEYVVNPVSESVWNIVFQWFNLLNDLGQDYNKRLLLKLPFRSDLIVLCAFIHKIIKENKRFGKEYGLKGVTLINTINRQPKTALIINI